MTSGGRLLALYLVTAAAAACGTASEAGDRNSRLVVAIPRDGGPINPYSGPGDFLLGLVYDKLFEPSPYVDAPWPALATGAIREDALTWLVTLREGVHWHDGRPLTADDVAFTFEYYRDGPPNRYGHHVSAVPLIEGVDIVDSVTVRFRCGYPCPTLARITLADLPILPRHRWEGVTNPRTLTRLPIGTGPYILEEYRPDQSYRFRANLDYALGTPVREELIFPVLPDVTASFVALETGQIDAVARPVPPELVESFGRKEDIQLLTSHALSIVELRPNYRRPPFEDPDLRRALSLAIDRVELVDRVMLGRAGPGDRGYPHPASPWTDPGSSTPFDPERARALLDSLGFLDRDGDGVRESPVGVPLRMELLVDASESARVRTAEIVARQLAGFGFELDVVALEAGALSERSRVRDYDVFVSEIGPHGAADPDQFMMSHLTGYLWQPELPFPEWEVGFEAWKAAATVPDRLEASFVLQRLFNNRPTSIALYYPEQDWAFRPSAHNGWTPLAGIGVVHKWSLVER